MTYEEIIQEIEKELDRASTLFGPFNSDYEGYAVIQEEVEELWDEIKKKSNEQLILKMREEAIQIAAMALRFVVDRRGWDKKESMDFVRGHIMKYHEHIFSHHDGYGRLQKKMVRLLNSVGSFPAPYDIRRTPMLPALSILIFMIDFIFDTMNGEYEEKLDDEILGRVLAESALGR